MTSPADFIARTLRSRGATLACAESCTGGLLAEKLTSRAGASAFFRGGAVVYATDTKTTLLGVPADLIARYGVVSRECAEAMARGAAKKFGADFALSATGFAGPEGGGAGTPPVGTVFIGLSLPAGTTTSLRFFSTAKTREKIRREAVRAALDFLAGTLAKA